MDPFNRYGVGMRAGNVTIAMPPSGFASSDDALVYAAWIVTLADPLGERFQEAIQAVQGT